MPLTHFGYSSESNFVLTARVRTVKDEDFIILNINYYSLNVKRYMRLEVLLCILYT